MHFLTFKRIFAVTFLIFCIGWFNASSQQTYFSVYADSLARELPALNKTIEISVTGVSMQEFLRSVANASGLNLNVDPSIELKVVNNFKDVTVKSILLFLERNYPIEITAIDNIININKKEIKEKIDLDLKGVTLDSVKNLVTLDFTQADITLAAREITKVTKQNIILSPAITNKKVSGFVQAMPLKSAVEQFAFTNDLILKITENGYFVLEPKPVEQIEIPPAKGSSVTSKNRNALQNADNGEISEIKVTKSSGNKISVISSNAPLKDVIKKVSDELGVNYCIGTELTGTVSLNYNDINYEFFLRQALISSPYVFRKEYNIYLIGWKKRIN